MIVPGARATSINIECKKMRSFLLKHHEQLSVMHFVMSSGEKSNGESPRE